MIGENLFWINFVNLCNEHNIKPNPLAKELGISSGTLTGWKKGSSPRDTAVQKIANYFNVSPEYLLGKSTQKEKTATTDDLSAIKQKILNNCANLSEKELDDVLDYIEYKISQHNH